MSRVRLALVSLSLILVAVVCGGMQSPQAAGGPALEPHVPGEILLKFQPGARGIERASVMAQLNARHLHTFREGGEHWQLGPGRSVEQAIDTLSRNPNIEHVTPNYILTAEVVPNDPNLPQLYGMINTGQTGGTNDADIDADQAWGVTTGSHSVVVGIIDTGVDYTHPDLAANIWTNPGEIPGNMIDDDLNGFVDDIHGYDFVNNDADPFDDNGHGTHCAGTIGAVGNNGIGVVGVNWNVSIMGLKFLSASGSGSTANAVRAVNYATQMGADLTSNSWGGGGASPDLQAAIAAAGLDEIPFVAAAGNNGTNNDTSPHYPSNYNLPNVISVAASDHNDAPASFTNYGPTTVHIAAPGVNILSTQPGNRYQLLSGTSMATPHVAGVVALLKSRLPNIPAAQVRTALMIAADPVAPFGPGGSKPIISGGRLNAFFAIADPDEDPPGAVGDLAAGDPSSNSLTLSWTATGDDGSTGTATFYQIRYATSPIDETNFAMATRAGAEPNPLASGSPQSMEVKGLDYETFYYFAIKAFDEWGNAGPISNIATGTTLPAPTAGLSPTAVSDALFTGQTADHTVMLRNDGVGTLDFTIPDPLVSEPLAVYPDLPLDKDEPDPRQGILGSGGPDASGYRWRDSDEPGGPGFGWTDISGVGTPIAGLDGDDEIATGIPIGFPFNFYGNSFTSVNVNTNGWLSFTDTTASGAKAYSNQPLPNGGAPANMLAVFWDDLHFRAALRAHYYNDGSRFIVQWTNVDRYDTTTPSNLTFQAILYPSGRIVYQYLSMQSAQLASATIGIQDANGTDGLTVVYNSGYVHNDLAVEFSRIPQWLTASPASGRIPAGGSMPISVHLDASGLEGGTYPGAVNIGTNDPGNPVLSVDVTLVVTGAPDAVVTPASIDFGDIFLGTPNERTLTVLNDGTDVLHVSSVSVSDPQIALAPDMFDVANHAAQQVTVTLTPSSLGPFAGSITVASDDAGQPTIVVPVTANSIPTPVVQINPASISDTLFSGNTSAHNLRVSNAGGSDLILTAGVDLGNGALGAPGVIYDDPSALGSGGPDGFGYRWKDSDEPGGPIFGFVDIRSTGTLVTFPSQDDSLSGVHSMGMDFPFYGNTFSSFKVSTNGWMTFNTTATSSVNTNTNLPSTTLPANSIALFWDDLHIRNRGTVHYLYDGLKFIIQYTDFDRFSTTQQPYPAHLTFQAHLYPSGRIIMMYETMTGFMTSATVGIHNGTRTIGLPVNFNSAYMHNNLAVQIHRTPDWLRVAPAGATVPPGSFQDFTVTLDSTDRSSGLLQGNVVLGTNIPGQETVQVPVALTVIGAPDVLTSPISHDFGTVYIGYPQLTSFYVVNNGTADLNVSDVTTTHPDLLVEDQPGPTAGFVLAPGAARLMTLRFAPSGVGLLNAAVQVHSDDPDSPTFELAVTGQSFMPPVAVHSPASFTESLNVGETVDRTLHLENQGLSDLSFDTGIRLLSGATVTVHSELELKKEDENDPRPGILGLGGPDMFGYTWEDSDASGGPVFDWVDISATGTPVAGLDADDENLGPIPIGFPFSFYGNTFTGVRVGTNGFLTFTSTLTAITNNPLPNSGSSVPENLLAAFWDDLEFRGTERAQYLNDGTRFIVQYTDVDRVGTAGNSHLTFQVILYPNGRIVYQYLTMDSATLTSATIGIQNSAKNDGLTVVHNLAYAHGGLAIAFTPPFAFPSVTPSSGVIPPGGSMDLNVRLDASGLVGGDYSASIDLSNNDPARGLIQVPVSVHITGTPEIDAQPASLAFPTTFVGFGSAQQVTLHNNGTDVLQITNVSVAGDFAVSGLSVPVDVPVNGVLPIDVVFSPTLEGLRSGSITIESNDPDEAMFVVPLAGNGLYPPEINATPSSISTALPPGGMRTKTVTLSNAGASDLNWSAGASSITATGAPVTVYTELELGRDEIDPRAGILGTGGPDMFGYEWKDSDEPGGPAFNWVDISGVGTEIQFDPDGYCVDCTSGPFSIGFNFPFYGNSFNEVRITTEGWVSFTSNRTTFTNQPLPNSGTTVPENLIAAFWDDLVLRNGTGSEPVASHGYYHNDGTRFIIQWTNFYVIADYDTNFTFQTILYPNGKIVHQYLTMANGRLNSATIGQQNATKTDGLTVVHNLAYMHDGLAIQIQAGPDWITVSPESGTIPAGGTQDVDVLLNAAGLEDGIHEAEIQFTSNDPYTPLLSVPVTLNVSLVEPTYMHFDPEVLNLSSGGRCVKVTFELPAGLDPHAVNLSSLTLNDTISYPPNPCGPPEYADLNGNGIEELSVKFDRSELEAALGSGQSVPLTLQGEVADVQWFRGTMTVRAIRPQVASPNGGEFFAAGQPVSIEWSAVNSSGPVSYAVQLTRDGGTTWEELASGVTGTTLAWVADGAPTSEALVRVVALDNQGVMGYDLSDGAFAIATQALPPGDVGDTLELSMFGGDVVLSWKRPIVDALHGPVEHYLILAAESAQGPFVQIGTTQAEEYRITAAGGPSMMYYKVLAGNAAGSSAN